MVTQNTEEMPMDNVYDAIKLIATRSPAAMREAIKSLRAPETTIQMRYNWLVDIAMSDPQAEFSQEEQAALVELMVPEGETRDYTLRIRLTDAERARLHNLADEQGQNLSEYVRNQLF